MKSGEIMAEPGQGILKSLKADAADIGMIVAIVGILMAMIIPLPAFILDGVDDLSMVPWLDVEYLTKDPLAPHLSGVGVINVQS